MAAARRMRRTRLSRKRKMACRRTVRRKPLSRQKKQPFKQMRKVQARPLKQRRKRPFNVFVSKVLRQLHRDRVPITTKAKGKMISFIRKFYNSVSTQAKRSKKFKSSCTVGAKEMQNALKRVMGEKDAMDLVHAVQKVARQP